MDLERLKKLADSDAVEKLVDKFMEAVKETGLDIKVPEDRAIAATAMGAGFLVNTRSLQSEDRALYSYLMRVHQRGILDMVMGESSARQTMAAIDNFFKMGDGN